MGQILLWCWAVLFFSANPIPEHPDLCVSMARDGEDGRVGGRWDWEKRVNQGTGNNPSAQ